MVARSLVLSLAASVVFSGSALAQPVEIEPPPFKQITTFNIDGKPKSIQMFGQTYTGVLVTHVGPKGVGQSLGLVPGDVLLSLNADPLRDAIQADDLLSHSSSGDIEVCFARQSGGTYKLTEKRIKFNNPLKDNMTFHGGDIMASEKSQEELEADAIELINKDRKEANRGLQPLQRSEKLSKFARFFAQDMVNRHYFNHVNPEGCNLQERARLRGMTMSLAENLANGLYDPEDAEALFMNEPDLPHNHRGHILDAQFAYVGVGVAKAPDNTLVIVQQFSAESPDEPAKSKQAAEPENERDLKLDLPPGVKP
jgi:uncharacterized protein YkwD